MNEVVLELLSLGRTKTNINPEVQPYVHVRQTDTLYTYIHTQLEPS